MSNSKTPVPTISDLAILKTTADLAEQGQLPEAEALLHEQLAQDPADPVALLGLGQLAAHAGLVDDAHVILEAALMETRARWPDQGNAPLQAEIQRSIARTHDSTGQIYRGVSHWLDSLVCEDTPEAREALARARQVDDSNKTTLFKDIQAPAGLLEQAERVCGEELARQPDDAEASFQLGNVKLLQKKYDEALPLLERASQRLSERADVFYSLALTAMGLGQTEAARTALLRSHELAPSLDTCLELGMYYAARGEHAEAIDMLRLGAQDHPDGAALLAGLLSRERRYDEAIAVAQYICDKFPTSARCWVLLGRAHYTAGDPEQAMYALMFAIHLAPDDDDIHTDLGSLLSKLNAHTMAEVAYRRAMALNPENLWGYTSLIACLSQQQKYDQAHDVFDQAESKWPDNPELYLNVSVVECEQGDVEKAFSSVHHAIEQKLIELAELPPEQMFEEKKEQYMVVHDAHVALLAAHEALTRAGVPFFLIGGTLLGIIRDGDLLPFDKDMDFGLWSDVSREAIVGAFNDDPDFMVPDTMLDPKAWVSALHHKPTDIIIDMFFFHRDGDSCLEGFDRGAMKLRWRYRGFELKPLPFLGVEFLAPESPERFFEDIYGSEWRIPDPGFDAVVAGYCLTPESKDLCSFYGYERLFSALRSRRWAKTMCYAKQIRKWGPHPILDQVEAFIRERDLA